MRSLLQSGGVVNPKTDAKALIKAEALYEQIRKREYDCLNVERNTNFPLEAITLIKSYIFNDRHLLHSGNYERFYPDYRMAESWRRLSSKNCNEIKPHDLLLLQHEWCEIIYLVNNNCSVTAAHEYAEKLYNYSVASDSYYDSIFDERKKNNK